MTLEIKKCSVCKKRTMWNNDRDKSGKMNPFDKVEKVLCSRKKCLKMRK